jgi:DNA-binding CsgD family transcriptional regulator
VLSRSLLGGSGSLARGYESRSRLASGELPRLAARAAYLGGRSVAKAQPTRPSRMASAPASRRGLESLTERELQVARLVADGKTNPEIAAEPFLSKKTVETRKAPLFVSQADRGAGSSCHRATKRWSFTGRLVVERTLSPVEAGCAADDGHFLQLVVVIPEHRDEDCRGCRRGRRYVALLRAPAGMRSAR